MNFVSHLRFNSVRLLTPMLLLGGGWALSMPLQAQEKEIKPVEKIEVNAENTPKKKVGWNGQPLPSKEELKKTLSRIQYAVTQENGTERPFTNEFWKHYEEGIYVDITSGVPLFSSKDKFPTDCGWPAFAKPIEAEEIKNLKDTTHGMVRVEVRSATGDAHLGHVFEDGPKELGGLRYCINSAALRFVPRAKMQEAGYGSLLHLFEGGAEDKKTAK